MVSPTALFVAAFLTASTVLGLPQGFGRVYVPQEHFEVMDMRVLTSLNPAAVRDTICLDPRA